MILGRIRKCESHYTLNSDTITAVNSHRDLGVMISSDLSWSDHIKHITARAYKTLGLLRRTFSSCHSPGKKKTLYISLVKSQLLYCSQIWRPRLDIKVLEKVQRRATKWILNNYSMDYKDRLVNLDMLPLMYVLELNDVLFCIKGLKAGDQLFDMHNFVCFSDSSIRSGKAFKMRLPGFHLGFRV